MNELNKKNTEKEIHAASLVARINKERVPQQGTRLRSKSVLLEQTHPIPKHQRITKMRTPLKQAPWQLII